MYNFSEWNGLVKTITKSGRIAERSMAIQIIPVAYTISATPAARVNRRGSRIVPDANKKTHNAGRIKYGTRSPL